MNNTKLKKGVRLGIDLGGTQLKAALVAEDGKVIRHQSFESPLRPHDFAKTLYHNVKTWLRPSLVGTGVAVAGDVDPTRGLVRFSPNLKWRNVPLKKILLKYPFPSPLLIENDATAAAWGVHHLDLAGQSRSLLVLTLGTGVGGGIVIDGKLYHGATGSAGEWGHMTIDPDGIPCGCGSRGCLETCVGGIYLVRKALSLLKSSPKNPLHRTGVTPKALYELALKGDPLSLKVWKEAGKALGIGLASLINIFNPDTIVFTGGVAGASKLLMRFADKEIKQRAFRTGRDRVRIRTSSHRTTVGVVGAALLVP
ncbi:MAG TPA: ROK family protein [Elusimicrobiota bacterium]|nr:ROK family protein [Elusimicrobiota bacterium]